LPVGKLLLGVVARLDPVKNHLGVFHAIDLLRRQGLDVAIGLAGDGPLRDELEKAARDLGIGDRVHFLGNVKQIDVFYSALDVFVLNSHSEGMSNTVLEAMASGLPVVATAVGSNPELVVEGRTGLLVPPGDVASLADGLARLARLPGQRQAMGAAGRRRAESQYSIDRMVRQYETLYERLAVRARSSTGPRTANFSPSSSCVIA
jgi:glycosyltransferase involved in cell wall biosynthesis